MVGVPSSAATFVVVVGSSTSDVKWIKKAEQAQENAMWNPVSVIGKGKPENARMCLLKRMTEAESEIQREAAAAFWIAAAAAEEVEEEGEEEVEAEEGRGGGLLLLLLLLLLGDELPDSLAAGTFGG